VADGKIQEHVQGNPFQSLQGNSGTFRNERTLLCRELCQILGYASFFTVIWFNAFFFNVTVFTVQFLDSFFVFLILFIGVRKMPSH
jgi:hypothetical protein